MRALGGIAAIAIALSARAASADHALGTRLDTNAYRVDLFQGPVLSSSRVTGLAGAYSPIAEGVEGMVVNPAAPAVRVPWSRTWFDYDLGFGVTFPTTVKNTDFDNDGETGFRHQNFYFATAGALAQFGPWGAGVSFQGQTYTLGAAEGAAPTSSGSESVRILLARYDLSLARTFFDGQVAIGLGLRTAVLDVGTVQGTAQSTSIFQTTSAGPQLGALWAPHRLPIRLAFSARGRMDPNAEVKGQNLPDANGHRVVAGRYVPQAVELPWEIEMGFAIQLGPRPLNLPFIDPHHPPAEYLQDAPDGKGGTVKLMPEKAVIDAKLRDRYLALPRRKLLIVTSLLVSGPVDTAVSVESFLRQDRVFRSGQRVSVTPRLGLEAEPFEDAVQLRLGTYLEPGRIEGSTARPHLTLGFDVRALDWDLFGLLDPQNAFRVGAFGDLARQYFAWGITLGIWH